MLLSTLASSLPGIPIERRGRPRIPHAVHGILAGNLFPSEDDISQAMSISPEDLQITYTSLFRCMCRMDDFYRGSPENLKRFHRHIKSEIVKENFASMMTLLNNIVIFKGYTTIIAPEMSIILQTIGGQYTSIKSRYNSIMGNKELSDEGIIASLGTILPDIRTLFQTIKDTAHPNKLFPKKSD